MIKLWIIIAALFLPVAAQAQITCPAPVGPGRVVGDISTGLSNSFSYYETGATITAPRTWTLPPASTVNKYCMMIFSDQFGGVTPANPVTIVGGTAQSGKQDLIGGNTSVSLNSQYAVIFLQSDGSSKWVVANATTSLYNGQQSVPTNAVLKAAPTTLFPNGVWRLDYAVGNGAPPLFLRAQSRSCAINGYANDGGTCVDTVGGNSWLVPLSLNVAEDIREWGIVAGTGSLTANTSALTAIHATTRPTVVSIPEATFGFACGTTFKQQSGNGPISFVGQGAASVLQVGSSACTADYSWWPGGFLQVDSVSGVSFRNFTLDLNGLQAVGVGSSGYATSTNSAIAGTTLTVGGTVGGAPWAVGMLVTGSTTADGTYITALGSGTGGAGTYTVNINQSVSATYLNGSPGAATSTAASTSGSVLTVGGTITGTWAVGQTIWSVGPAGISARAYHITSQLTGSAGGAGTYQLDGSPGTVSSREFIGAPDLMAGILANTSTSDITGLTIEGVRVINANSPTMNALIAIAASAHDIYNAYVSNNYLQMTASIGFPLVGGNECIAMSGAHDFYNPMVVDNKCNGSGIQITGLKGGMVSRNEVYSFAFGAALYCTDFSSGNPTGKNWLINNNHFHDGATTLDVSGTGTPMSGIENHCPLVTMDSNNIHDNGGPGISNDGGSVNIVSNITRNNGANPVYAGLQTGIFLDKVSGSNTNVLVAGNNSTDGGGSVQKYGLSIGANYNNTSAIALGANLLVGSTADILNNATTGWTVFVPVYYPNIAGSINGGVSSPPISTTGFQVGSTTGGLFYDAGSGNTVISTNNNTKSFLFGSGGVFQAQSGGITAGGSTSPPTNGIYSAGPINANASYQLAGTLASSSTAITIASGGCTTGSAQSIQANGTASFAITLGGATCGSSITLTLPSAAHGWSCDAADITTPAGSFISQTAGGSATSVTLTNYVRTTGIAGNFTAADVIAGKCMAY